MKTRNAMRLRFVDLTPVYADPVTLTLEPGQTLTAHGGGRTEEGYHQWYASWTWDTDDGVLRYAYACRGADCDGRYDEGHTYVCPVSLTAYDGTHPVPRALAYWADWANANVVQWKREEQWQRDHAAEAMGY